SISGSRGISIPSVTQHFREICRDPRGGCEPGGPQLVEVLTQIALVIRLGKRAREKIPRRAGIRVVARPPPNPRGQTTAQPQHGPDLRHGRAANARRQFVEQIYTGDDIKFRGGKGHRLGFALYKPSAGPGGELAPGDGKVMRRQVEARNVETWIVRLYLAEK